MNYLGIDYGTSKIGLATGYENIAVPSGIIATREALIIIPEIVKEKDIGTVVVGIADHMDGRSSDQSHRTRSFIGSLKKALPPSVRVIEWDERLSTFEANMSFERAGHKKDKDMLVDDIAAAIILQSFLERQKKD